MNRWIAGIVQAVGAAAGLAVAAWLLWLAVWALIRVEEPLGQLWYAVYLYAGRATLAILAAIAVVAALHCWWHGRDDMRPNGPADRIRWWALPERVLHWGTVLSFVLLLVTGVEMYEAGFGLPTPLTRTMRAWHGGEPFMVLGALLFATWVRDALPRRHDLVWLRHLGGHVGGWNLAASPLPAGRFNAGQKIWFWLEAAAGLVMALTGRMMLDFSRMDDGYLTLLSLHLAAAVVFLSVLGVHFYLAVIGVRGALGGMVFGYVGRQGAARLHPLARALRTGVR